MLLPQSRQPPQPQPPVAKHRAGAVWAWQAQQKPLSYGSLTHLECVQLCVVEHAILRRSIEGANVFCVRFGLPSDAPVDPHPRPHSTHGRPPPVLTLSLPHSREMCLNALVVNPRPPDLVSQNPIAARPPTHTLSLSQSRKMRLSALAHSGRSACASGSYSGAMGCTTVRGVGGWKGAGWWDRPPSAVRRLTLEPHLLVLHSPDTCIPHTQLHPPYSWHSNPPALSA